MVRRISAREARANFSEVMGSVHYTNEPVIVEKNGKPYAVVVSPEQFEAMERDIAGAWRTIAAFQFANRHLDPEAVMATVTAEVEAMRRDDVDEGQRGHRGR